MRLTRFFPCLFILFFLFQVQFFQILTANVPPTEHIPDTTVLIPMRDGIELPTDIYLPSPDAGKLPCILIRSPGGRKAQSATPYISFSKLGYAVAIQDTRSALDKEGKTLPYWSDGWGVHQDGYDTVEWLAKSKYTNGSIGTMGFSALGITQLLLAPTAPPALKCQYVGFAAASLYQHAIFPGGQLLKNQVEGWLNLYARDPAVRSYVCNRPTYNDFWKGFDSTIVAHRIKTPAIHYGGWYDIFLQGTIDAFVSRQESGAEGAKGTQKLVIGPWSHFWPINKKLGDFDVPKQGQVPPVDITPQRWFDYYLKGIKNGSDTIPAVTYYVMGPFDGSASSGNVWRNADSWPIPSVATPLYLTATHGLSKQSPVAQSLMEYKHDVNVPVPTVGGRNLFLESGPKDQKEIEQRQDVLVFTTEPLEHDLEVTGRIQAKIFFSTDLKDSDIVVRLTDVYPDGRSLLISDGILRFGETTDTKEISAVDKEKPRELDIDLWSTSMVFAKGHRIRVSISNSNYPRYEKNCHHGHSQSSALSNNKLFIGSQTASRLILPVVEKR